MTQVAGVKVSNAMWFNPQMSLKLEDKMKNNLKSPILFDKIKFISIL